jgi:preprotein translocase subunit SecE
VEDSSSIGRAPVSKTGGWGFDSLLSCQPSLTLTNERVSSGWQAIRGVGTKALRLVPAGSGASEGGREVMAEPTTLETVRDAAGGRFEQLRVFLSEVRNELKRVTWPSQKEVYATTVVVILTSVFFGLYLFILDIGIDRLVTWIFNRFGAA